MKNLARTVLAVLFTIGVLASCDTNEVDELNIQQPEEEMVEGTGGGYGGDEKLPD